MRWMPFLSLVLMISIQTTSDAQNDLQFAPDLEKPQANPVQVNGESEFKEAVDDDALKSEQINKWTPQIRVILNEHRSGGQLIQSRTEQRRVLRPVKEAVRVGGKTVTETRYVAQDVTVSLNTIADGVTIIDCDGISTEVSINNEGNKQFDLTLSGQFELRNGQLKLKGESAELKEGVLTIKNAEIQVGELTLNSEMLEINLKVESVRITEPAPNLEPNQSLQPTPVYDDAFQPSGVPYGEPTPFPSDSFTTPDATPAQNNNLPAFRSS